MRRKLFADAIYSLSSTTLEYPEIGKQGPAIGMTGVDAKTQFAFGNSLGQFTVIGAQMAKCDMRIGIVRI